MANVAKSPQDLPKPMDGIVDHAAVLLIALGTAAALCFLVSPLAAMLPALSGFSFVLGYVMSYMHAVKWSREVGIRLHTVSPRVFRKGRFSFPELRVVRIVASDKSGLRTGWLVAYRRPTHLVHLVSWHDLRVYWDDEG